MALQIGFLRMTGRLLEAPRMVPPALWRHLGAQFGIEAPLEALTDDPKVNKLRAALDRRVGEAQLPELILAVDAEVRFS